MDRSDLDALARTLPGFVAGLQALERSLGLDEVPRPTLTVVEGTAKRRTKRRGKLAVVPIDEQTSA